MKKYLLLFCMIIMIQLLFSALVPEATILQVATNWLELQTNQIRTPLGCTPFPDSTNPNYWEVIFNRGFVIVSADNRCLPILAFCTQKWHGSDSTHKNEAAKDLLMEYSLQIEDAKNSNRSNSETLPVWNAIINQTISIDEQCDIGLESPQWGGSNPYPYNNYCPWDNHNLHDSDYNGNPIEPEYRRSVAGCVATAIAQICHYYEHWNYTFTESDRYTSNKHGFSCEIDLDASLHDFPDFPTLNAYMDDVVYKYDNHDDLTDNDKAALSFACGILEQTSYSSKSSSAYFYGDAFNKLNMYNLRAWCSSYSNEAWLDLIKKQLRFDRPIAYVGRPNSSGGEGHAYIISGFQTTNENTTLNLVNWGRPWHFYEYWSLQPLNPASLYGYDHRMLYGIAPIDASINLTISLEDGSTDYSEIILKMEGHDGIHEEYESDDGFFDFALPSGTYDFSIIDKGNYFETVQINDVIIQEGDNTLDPIDLRIRPRLIIVPDHTPSIQEAIDLVREGGTVIIRDGNYIVSGLSWEDKHIELRGQTQDGVVLTNDPDLGLPAIILRGNGINHQDIISQITFSNCDLTGENSGNKKGAAIELLSGATPLIRRCTFSENRVGNINNDPLNVVYGKGTGGAVFIGETNVQQITAIFTDCIFTENLTIDGIGGGAVSLYGPAQFIQCKFTDNKTTIATGNANLTDRNVGGAIFVYRGMRSRGDFNIDFNECIFKNNSSINGADDVFVANMETLNELHINRCTFAADTPFTNIPNPAIKFTCDRAGHHDPMNTHLLLTDNKFLSSRKGAVYFCDYNGENRLTFTGNVVANNMYEGYGFYSWYPDGTSPENTDYFVFNNNTFSNINGSGLVLYQSPSTIINNIVFEDCSEFGICWGDHDVGHPEQICRGLTVNHSLFSYSCSRYDFLGDSNHPLEENYIMIVHDINLDDNYQPIWNTEIKSLCIDNGNPDTNGNGETWITDPDDRDLDGTQKDIGAIPLYDNHIQWTHELTNNKVRYICIPGVVSYPGSEDQQTLSYVFDDFKENNLFSARIPPLDKIIWMYNEYEGFADTSSIPEHLVHSQIGYKVILTDNAPDTLIQYQGFYPGCPLNRGMFIQSLNRYTAKHFILPPDPNGPVDGNTGIPYREIYLGYYLPKSLKPFDALSPIIDNITLIQAEDWAMARLPVFDYVPVPGDEPSDAYTDTWLGCFPIGGREIRINSGEMVVVRYIGEDPVEFKLGGNNPNPPFVDPYYRETVKHFKYVEQPDYVPIFLSIDLNQYEDGNKPVEVAVFVDDKCKGAAVVTEEDVQLNAYITNIEDPTQELKNLEFRMYFPQKSANAHVLDYSVLNNQSGRFESRKVAVSECKEFLQVKIGETDEPLLPSATKLFNNYPNPFNPETTISFNLAEQGFVTIEVFNIRGQKVKTVVKDAFVPGHHSVVWDGTDRKGNPVSSGMYFYRMNSQDHFSTKKMLLLK